MDDFKLKLKGLIQKQPYQIPVMSPNSSLYLADEIEDIAADDISKSCDKSNSNLINEEEIIKSIDPVFYNDETNLNIFQYELQKLKDNLGDSEELLRQMKILKTQHQAVSKQVLDLIHMKQENFNSQFSEFQEIQNQLSTSLLLCRATRFKLGFANNVFSASSLKILATYRRRNVTMDLLKSLNTIRGLLQTEKKLHQLLQEENYPVAVSLILECTHATTGLKHFSCVAALSTKLQDTLVMTEEHLDSVLSKMCLEFKSDIYTKLNTAYSLLGKTQVAIDQLLMHFTSTIHNRAFSVVQHHVNEIHLIGPKKQFVELCKYIPDSKIIPCLISLCKVMWSILKNYHNVVNWHQKNISIADPVIDSETSDFEKNLNKQYIEQKLQGGFSRLWNDVQGRVSNLILSCNLSVFKFDEFLQVLAIVYKLTLIGEEFCSSDSMELHSSVKTQSSNYLIKYHTACLDELRIFLENEAWTPCPVKSDFTILHLQEFRSLRQGIKTAAGTQSSTASNDGSSVCGSVFFQRYVESDITPFDNNQLDLTMGGLEEDILHDYPDDPSGYYSEDSDEGHNKQSYDSMSKQTCFLTNTSLSILRLCGKYLQMSKYLKLIASNIIYSLFQLFEYYLYIVYTFFSLDQTSGNIVSVTSLKLQSVLKRIKDNLIMVHNNEGDHHHHNSSENLHKVAQADISSDVDLINIENLFGLNERIVGVESLIFLSSQFQLLHGYLEHILSDNTKNTLHQFYTQTITVVTDLRKPVYACVAWKVLDTQRTLSFMSRVDWAVSDIIEKHSPYVDSIIEELHVFMKRLDKVISKSEIKVPSAVTRVLWENIVTIVIRVLIEGFSCARKCSSGGRALMQLDWVQLNTKLEEMSSVKPLPRKDLIENYLKAYYFQENSLEDFLKNYFNDYSYKQLESLVNCALICHNDKKTRQKLLNILEEQKSQSHVR